MIEWERCLREVLAEILQIETQDVSAKISFAELGLDSLTGLRFMRRVEDVTGVGLELEWIFDYPTPQQLAQFLNERLGSLNDRLLCREEGSHAVQPVLFF